MLLIKKLREDVVSPTPVDINQTVFSLYADITEPVMIYPGESATISTGVKIDILNSSNQTDLLEYQKNLFVFSCEEMVQQHNVVVSHPTFVIDSEQEIKITLSNLKNYDSPQWLHLKVFTVDPGMEIARFKILINAVIESEIQVVPETTKTP